MKRHLTWLAIGLAGALVACGESGEARKQRDDVAINEASQFVATGKFNEAKIKLATVVETPEVTELRRRASEGLLKQEAKRVANEAGATAASIKAPLQAQSNPISNASSTSFETCLASIDRVAAQFDSVPSTIVDSHDAKIVRFHTTDGSVLVTCSRLDGKMVLTRSSRP